MKPDAVSLPGPAKYLFMRALRPFSLSVALVTCGLGIALAWHAQAGHVLRAVLVVLAGVLLQSAVNLFNDYADLDLFQGRDDDYAQNITNLIRRNTRIAQVMAGVAVVMGLYLVFTAGFSLFVLGLTGLIGGYFYTGKPIAYKNRGLGVVGVFLFTGILMVTGSFMAVTGYWSDTVLLYSIPVSLVSSMLLLANELRDHQEDIENNICTFTVRVGFTASSFVYQALGLLALFSAWGIAFSGGMDRPWLMLLPLFSLKAPIQMLRRAALPDSHGRKSLLGLPPLTGRFFMIFGMCMMAAI